MTKLSITDESGAVLQNLYRDAAGAIIVNDVAGLNKYNYQKSLEHKIKSQHEEILEIKSMLAQILRHMHNTKEE